MENIDRIRKLVFDTLIENYAYELDSGKNFFTMERSWSHFDNSELDFINEVGLRILFYGKWRQSPIAYLFITESETVYLIIQFNARSDYDSSIRDVLANLKQFSGAEFRFKNKLRTRSGMSSPDSISHVYEVILGLTVEGKLKNFLTDIKPEIDNILVPIRGASKYSYLFFNLQQFQEYLLKEPFYSVPEITEKRDIRLKSLRIQDFHGISETEIRDLPASARWIVLTGENGFGKTSILQAIAAGLSGNYDENNQQLVPDTAYVGIEYYSNGEVFEINSRATRRELSTKRLQSELAAYGSSRLEVTALVTKEALENQFPNTYHLFNANGLLLNIEQMFKDSEGQNRGLYSQLESLFKNLIPQLHEIKVDYSSSPAEVLYVEMDQDGKPLNNGVPFGHLAAGFKNILAMVGDLLYRLFVKQGVSNLSDVQGIVIIDELELHLHPSYQKLLPEVLTREFPNLQFVVSTHSPIPLLGIPKDVEVILLNVNRSHDAGVQVEKLDIDFSVLTPNAILTSPIFGFQDLIPDSKLDKSIVNPEDNYAKIDLDQKLRKDISDYLSDARQKELLTLLRK